MNYSETSLHSLAVFIPLVSAFFDAPSDHRKALFISRFLTGVSVARICFRGSQNPKSMPKKLSMDT